MYSPFAVDLASCTYRFPSISEMDGLVVLPYWSMLSAAPDNYNFDLFDSCLSYWFERGKKLIIGVVTVGFPLRIGSTKIIGATPDWLMSKVQTYSQEAKFVGSVRSPETPRLRFNFASYWDKRFQYAEANLIAKLGNYDGHPGVSKIRITTGIAGEDNPTFDGLRSAMPGFSNEAWISYCRKLVSLYKSTFKQTTLEFDIDRMGWIKARGTHTDRAQVDDFMEFLDNSGVYAAVDGLDDNNARDWVAGRNTGPVASLNYLDERHRAGQSVGLEGSSLSRLTEENLRVQAEVFERIGARRLVLFSDSAGAINYIRNGITQNNEIFVAMFGREKLDLIAKNGLWFFERLDLE